MTAINNMAVDTNNEQFNEQVLPEEQPVYRAAWIRRFFGVLPTKKEYDLIVKLTNNGNNSIKVVGRGGLVQSIQSSKGSQKYKILVEETRKQMNIDEVSE